MHPLSSTMEHQHIQNQGDIMGDVKKEQYGSANSLDNAERKRYFLFIKEFNKNAIDLDVMNLLNYFSATHNHEYILVMKSLL